jgi:hypothetical protein
VPGGSDVLFYEGLHGLVKTDDIDVSTHVDLGIGVVSTSNGSRKSTATAPSAAIRPMSSPTPSCAACRMKASS